MLLGQIGGIIVKLAFLSALAAAFFYYRGHKENSSRWVSFARGGYHLATLSLMTSSAILLYLILTHQFQYTYIWNYSSTDLPLSLLLSTFYAGQEGSFTLWALYTSIIGVFLMQYASKNDYEPEVMSVYSLILGFLLLMLVVKNPFAFIDENGIFEILKQGYTEDMALARAVKPEHETPHGAVYILPAKPWSRRVSGAFGNVLASAAPDRAHAVLTQRSDSAFVVSVRAPQSSSSGADILCSRFATGGGRKGAAGINRLPENELPQFMQAFDEVFSAGS